jgi:drug/metabolite transporter (DMT)-like permease
MTWAAIALALLAAFLFALASVAQQREAANTGEHGLRLFAKLLRNPRWWAGVGGDTGGYIAQAGALGLGSILLVQPVLVTTLLFALPLSARWNRRTISRSELWWASVLIVAIAVFVIAGDPGGGVDVAPFRDWLPSLVVIGVLVGISTAVILTRPGRPRALALAISTGLLYGLTSALTKSVMKLFADGPEPLLTSWETYVLVVVAITGTALQQMAFQAGSLEISLPAVTVLDPVVAGLLGIVALHEGLKADGPEWGLIGLSVLVMVIGTAALARAGVPTPPTGTAGDTTPPSPPLTTTRTPPGSPS